MPQMPAEAGPTLAMATAQRERDGEDQYALLQREDSAPQPAESASMDLPHASLSVQLESIEEHKSEFTLKGRTSFLWRSDRVLERAPTELRAQLYPELSADAQTRCCELIDQMLQLLRSVVETGSDYRADKYHPRQPVAQMEIKGESHFYEYRVSAPPAALAALRGCLARGLSRARLR